MWRFLFVSAVVAGAAAFTRAQSTESKATEKPSVLILRFETPGDVDSADWIGRAAQEDLATELTRDTTAHIKAPFEPKPASDIDSAIKRAKVAHATHVVFGQAQSVEGNVRITGQVADVESGKPLGTLKITGPRSSLFDLEDALARQVCALLPQDVLKPEIAKAIQENPPAPAIRLDDAEPEPIRVFPVYATPDYQIPERYDTAPTIVVNVNLPAYDEVIPGYAPTFGGPLAFSPLWGSPYAWYGAPYYWPYSIPPFAFNGFSSLGYPGDGWGPFGGVVVVNNGFNFRRGRGLHHADGFGMRNRFGGGFAGGVAGNGRFVGAGAGNGVAFEFTTEGGFFPGIPGNGFRPGVPAGGFAVGIPQTGFSVGGARFGGFRPSGFRGPAFGNGVRGGSAVR